jgi:hypothetical protein
MLLFLIWNPRRSTINLLSQYQSNNNQLSLIEGGNRDSGQLENNLKIMIRFGKGMLLYQGMITFKCER